MSRAHGGRRGEPVGPAAGEVLDISVDDAYDLLRRYAQANDDQLTTSVSRQLITEPNSRPAILAAMRQIQASRS